MNQKYQLLEFIAEGSYGKIYKGQNKITKEFVAIKIEPKHYQLKLLINESKVYYLLKKNIGIPSLKWFGSDEHNYYLITELLGFSVNELSKHTSLLTGEMIINIAKQMLTCICSFHEMKLIHRDIKPENFLFGLNENNNKIYLIDYGFCKSYQKEDNHIPLIYHKKIIGTPNYISLNIHSFQTSSRRDDIESWIYIVMDLLQLNTWKKYDYDKYPELFIKTKQNCIHENIPSFIKELLIYTRGLQFEETPNYSYLFEIINKYIYKHI